MATTPNYAINYDDPRFAEVEAQRDQALTEAEQMYGGMASESEKFYQDQINASKEWADKQAQLQQENTDFAIEQINQQKEQAKKDYTKEQSASYVDYQKQTNQFGAQAELQAQQGLANTGVSESAKISMFNTYQNRVASARESLNKAILNYDNNIQNAILQNNSALAEIHYNTLQQQLTLSLEGFQYENTLLQQQYEAKQQVQDRYRQDYQNVLQQMNTENAQREAIRQWEAEQAEIKRQFDIEQSNWQKEYELAKSKAEQERLIQERQLAIQQYNAETSYNLTGDLVTNSAYWNGARAENVGGYGYFSNGYQPKGIKDGNKTYKLEPSGGEITFKTKDLWGNSKTVTQTVWMANGKYYYWEGRENKYKTAKYDEETGTFKTT